MLGKKKLQKQIEQLIMKIEEKYSETDGIKVGYVLQDLYKLIGKEYDEIPLKFKSRITYKGKPLGYAEDGFVKTYCVKR